RYSLCDALVPVGHAVRRCASGRLLALSEPLPEAAYLSFVARSDRAHSTSLPLADALELDTLIALEFNGQPLATLHGGPVRTIVPRRYFYKSLKWLTRIEVLASDRLGYWEAQAGYHNEADPWREQRFVAPDLDRRLVGQLLATRDWSNRELRGLHVAGHNLAGLLVRQAILRDSDFSRADLRAAQFSGSNLSNARFVEADLRGAVFGAVIGAVTVPRSPEADSHRGETVPADSSGVSIAGADIQGSDFRGADLRGADFRGASLLGAAFTARQENEVSPVAQADSSTCFSAQILTELTPRQLAWLRSSGASITE
ncbi:MAG: molybdopterin-dependent oxidoreductase, partial [Planctomycetota bacterium]